MSNLTKAAEAIPDGGPIFPETRVGLLLGLNAMDFCADTYLWKQGDRILISLITVTKKGQGIFSRLLEHLFSLGFTVAVPTPLGRMQAILKAKGFRETWEDDPDFGACEVWVKEPEGVDASRSTSDRENQTRVKPEAVNPKQSYTDQNQTLKPDKRHSKNRE